MLSSTTSQEPGKARSRRPYTGHTRYITCLTLPPPLITANPASASSTVRIRKCNCSTCHKMSFFHVRLQSSPQDFHLLSPLSPATELNDYTCFKGNIHWYFCGRCGVPCFAFSGQGEVREVEVEGKNVTAWTPTREG